MRRAFVVGREDLRRGVATWGEPRPDPGSRRRVERARRAAFDRLATTRGVDPDPAAAAWLGLPTGVRARKMIAALQAELA